MDSIQEQPSSPPPKPRSELFRPDLTRLPRITFWRRLLRSFLRGLGRLLVRILTRATVSGLENYPDRGPFLIVSNHLGDADAVLHLAFLPRLPDAVAKVEMYDFPFVGKLMDAYGVIWIHRGQPDRKAISAVLQGFRDGRRIAIAPEGRYSLSGSLEEGTSGAAYFAIKAGVPIVPVGLTGTENEHVYGHLKRLRRAPVSFTMGKPFLLSADEGLRTAVQHGTEEIMRQLAALLPDGYRGFYRDFIGDKYANN